MPNVNFPNLTAQKVQSIWAGTQGIVDEGSYFVATNPTTGTGIATTTSVVDDGNSGATSAQTRPLMIVRNANAVGGNNIYPLAIKLLVTSAPTSATFWQMSIRLDDIARYTSGGSTIVPKKVNPLSEATSPAQIYFGAITAAAASSNALLVANSMANPTIPVVKDTMIITFGWPGADSNFGNIVTVNTQKVISVPPIVIPPGYSMVLGMWGTSNAAAPAFEFQFDYVER